MLVVPGSLEGASPSPLRPEAEEGLCPVKEVVWVLAAALRDLWESMGGWGRARKWAQRTIGNPLPPVPTIFANCTTLLQSLKSVWFLSLPEMHIQSTLFYFFPTQSQRIFSPLPFYLPPPNIPKPSTQPFPYPLYSQLTSEPTSFRKPSPIKEARVRIPSSPRHHQQALPPYSGSPYTL